MDDASRISYSGCGGVVAPVSHADFEERLVQLVNEERAERGLPPLKRSEPLGLAARYHATDMAQDEYFDHYTYDRVGGSLTQVCSSRDRIASYYPNDLWAGENIQWGRSGPQGAMSWWMDSPPHRANILHAEMWEVGAGYYGGGFYRHLWVLNFGRRSGVYPLVINADAFTTDSRTVTLYIYGDWDEVRLRSNDEEWSEWMPFLNTLSWTLPERSGEHTVWAEMRSAWSGAGSSDTIRLIDAGGPVRPRSYLPLLSA
jgi:hypothetical protein